MKKIEELTIKNIYNYENEEYQKRFIKFLKNENCHEPFEFTIKEQKIEYYKSEKEQIDFIKELLDTYFYKEMNRRKFKVKEEEIDEVLNTFQKQKNLFFWEINTKPGELFEKLVKSIKIELDSKNF
jgi:hypothetical protein